MTTKMKMNSKDETRRKAGRQKTTVSPLGLGRLGFIEEKVGNNN